ncbi:MAG TPA: CRISPR-associated protein Cas4 [Dehalococcoidia bacterium]|nr:CRISPR-associated protein Cas4 [Dehalococcoidia bacterium]
MYTEDELLPISALQHLAFCERQWALIHLEGVWEENRLTVEGRFLHDRPHEDETEVRGDLRIARGLRLRSLRLGLVGRVDVVEFHRLKRSDTEKGIPLEGTDGLWKPMIVEYKRGRPKLGREDEVQVCAQALCLEEILRVMLPTGSIFYGKPRRRYDVVFDDALREETESLTVRLHDLTHTGNTPSAEYSKKCKSCSLVDICMPGVTGKRRNVQGYLSKAIAEAGGDEL